MIFSKIQDYKKGVWGENAVPWIEIKPGEFEVKNQ